MSTSDWGARIQYQGTDWNDDDPMDTAMARAIANNALHLADQAGQVRACWGDFDTSSGNTAITHTFGGTNVWERVLGIGSFPVSVRADGSAYPMRVFLRGASASGSYTAHFRVTVCAPGMAARCINENDTDVESFSTTSTTDAWLAPSGGLIEIPADKVSYSAWGVNTIDGVAGNAVTAPMSWFVCEVWAMRDNALLTSCDLCGLYLAEYIGT